MRDSQLAPTDAGFPSGDARTGRVISLRDPAYVGGYAAGTELPHQVRRAALDVDTIPRSTADGAQFAAEAQWRAGCVRLL